MTAHRPARSDPRELVLESRVADARPSYRFRTVDGLHSTEAFRPSELLLLDALWERDLGEARCLEANYGVVGIVLAATAEAMELTESSARAVDCCRQNADLNDADVDVSLAPALSIDPLAAVDAASAARVDVREPEGTALDRPVDTTIYAPKPYTPLSIAEQRVADGLAATRPGGRFYLAASKETGRPRLERRLTALAADVRRVAARDGVHLLEARRPETVDRPTLVEPMLRTPTVDGTRLSLVALPGLFAASGLDAGTRLLLETCSVADGDRVLDVCCGYGPIGVYAAAGADCRVHMTDDDALAARCARASFRASGVDATVRTADCTDGLPSNAFDRVVCNPPTHAGSGVLSKLFDGIRRVLKPDGECSFVHHRDLDLGRYLDGFAEPTTAAVGDEHVVRRTVAR